ncbi:MAG: heme-binding beta-barrel domain-containing protein [Gammaproteobacteria bacterium]
MNHDKQIDFGPLQALIGVWKGDKGMDVAPEPDGAESSPYYETIAFSPVGEVTNAETQVLSALHYRQIVRRRSNGEVFHDQTGYWMWDSATGTVMHSLMIPRGVGVLAGGLCDYPGVSEGGFVIDVSAAVDDENWNIIQSPFMRDRARTLSFRQKIDVGSGKLSYTQTAMVEIYGKIFEHTDRNELTLQSE